MAKGEPAKGCDLADTVARPHPWRADQEMAEPGPLLLKWSLAPAYSDAPNCIGKRSSHDDDQRYRDRNRSQVCERYPQYELIGTVCGDIQHAAYQGSGSGSPGNDPIHGVEEERNE